MTKTAAQLTEGDRFIPAGRTYPVEVLGDPTPCQVNPHRVVVAYFLRQGCNVLGMDRNEIVEVLA